MVTLGISEAACAIIGNCIGAGTVPLAKRFFTIITKVEIVSILVVASIIFFLRTQISASYTREPEVKEMVSQVLILIDAMHFFDGI